MEHIKKASRLSGLHRRRTAAAASAAGAPVWCSFVPAFVSYNERCFICSPRLRGERIVSTLNPTSGRPTLVCWLYIFVSFAEQRHPSLRAVSCSPLVSTHLDKSSRPEMGSTWRPFKGWGHPLGFHLCSVSGLLAIAAWQLQVVTINL